jgi:TPR repeat protein
MSKPVMLGFVAFVLAITAASAQNVPPQDCDRLAAHPDDPEAKAAGLPLDKIDAGKAIAACESAVRQNAENATLNFQLGRAYERAGNFAAAVHQYQKAADTNYAASQSSLGMMYVRGLGVARDDAKALELFRRAADQGYAPGQANVGTMYQQGRGVTKNSGEALKWYRLAGDKNYALAQLNLGLMYAYGDGVEKDDAQAVKWFRLAVEQGDAAAQSNLGDLYRTGRGVAQDHLLAFMWLDLAAQRLRGAQEQHAVTNREIVARILSAEQVAQAQEMARQCEARNFKDCGAQQR